MYNALIIQNLKIGVVLFNQELSIIHQNSFALKLFDNDPLKLKEILTGNIIECPFYIEDCETEEGPSVCYSCTLKKQLINKNEKTNNKTFVVDFNQKHLKITIQLIDDYILTIIEDVTEDDELRENLYNSSITDELTGLYNRRYLDEQMSLIFDEEENPKISMIILDIDYFKNVNDNHGHLVGDEVLKELSQVIKDCLRKTDIAARYGGEEIAIILYGSNEKNTHLTAERIRRNIQEKTFSSKELKITISGGISVSKKNDTYEKLLEKADFNLYKAKNNGKNQIWI